MALRLEPLSLNGKFSYVSANDPALDRDAEDFEESWEKYLEGGLALPPIKNGEEPTVFELTPVTDAELSAHIQGKLDDTVGQKWAVEMASYCLTGIQNLTDSEGNPFRLKFDRVLGFNKVCKEHRNLIGKDLLVELGFRVINRKSPS